MIGTNLIKRRLSTFILLVSWLIQIPTVQGDGKVVLQVLGSGGPFGGDKRASCGYLIWVNERPRIMIDAGGGTFLRLQEVGAHFTDLETLCVTHLHPDHASDIPAILWSGMTVIPQRTLHVIGPAGNEFNPGIQDFLDKLLNPQTGAFPWLAIRFNDQNEHFKIIEAPLNEIPTWNIHQLPGLTISSISVPHSGKPALGFKIDIEDVSIGFGGDQNGKNDQFKDLVKDVDLLVMHLPISEQASGIPAALHAKPSVVGTIAKDSNAHRLLLSHFMRANGPGQPVNFFSLNNLNVNVGIVKKEFKGEVLIAKDLMQVVVTARPKQAK